MSPVHIAVDAAGADLGLVASLPGCRTALEADAGLQLRVSGPEAAIVDWQKSLPGSLASRVELSPCKSQVAGDESPASALRRRSSTSMGDALAAVRSGACQACVSAGNTGALLAISRFVLGTLPGIDRPAICSSLPARNGCTHVLDLGANLNVTADMLIQFAVMGAVVARITRGLDNPRVALLNVGTEPTKGHDAVRQAHQMLGAGALNYQGFVEGHDIFVGDVDVVVCDGFAGNVALKASEGLIQLIFDRLRPAASESNLSTRLAVAAAGPAMKIMRGKFDPRHYNGASLVGLSAVVVKSHGATDAVGFANALATAAAEARADMARAIGRQLVDEMNAEDSV